MRFFGLGVFVLVGGLYAGSALKPVWWSAISLPDVECPSQCDCWMHQDPATTYNNPPPCYASSSMQLTYAKDGCCQEVSGCVIANCKYSASITATAQPGQTCQFELFKDGVQWGATQTGSSVTFQVPVLELACGDAESIVLRVNGARVAVFYPHCANC
jgi:hypothetical protein